MRGQVVLVPPFAEELNKCRRMIRLQAEALSTAGFDVLVMDLLGTGDSPGDFGDADWGRWQEDVRAAIACIRASRRERLPLWLWGVRAGCALAAACARTLDEECNLLFWQPLGAAQQLQQFLRWATVGAWFADTPASEASALRAQLAQGSPVEIGGYILSGKLAQGMAADSFDPPDRLGCLVWIDVYPAPTPQAQLSPWAATQLQRWTQHAEQVNAMQVEGPSFWGTTEMEDAPLLLGATLQALGVAAQQIDATPHCTAC